METHLSHHLFHDVLSNLKVTNVSPSAQDSDLSDFFSTAGDISKLVVKDGLNNTKRATIDFKEKEAVSAALLLNGCLLLNHALCIEEIIPAKRWRIWRR